MAEDPGQIREAIGQTRADIGETVQAIGDKADIKGRAAKKATAGRNQLKTRSSQAQAKLADMGHRVERRLPDSARPVLATAAQGVEAGASGVKTVWKRQPWVGWATAALAGLLVAAGFERATGAWPGDQ